MVDLSFMLSGKSSQLNADDLDAAGRIIKITKVKDTGGEQPLALHFEGDLGRPFLPCLTMRRVLAHIWGTNGKVFIGRKLLVYRDADVTWAGKTVGGIRIKGASHIDEPISYTATLSKGKRKKITIDPIPIGEERQDKQPAPNDAAQQQKPQESTEEKRRKIKNRTQVLIDQVKAAKDRRALEDLTGSENFVRARNWLRENAEDLFTAVDVSIRDRLTEIEDQEMADLDMQEMPA